MGNTPESVPLLEKRPTWGLKRRLVSLFVSPWFSFISFILNIVFAFSFWLYPLRESPQLAYMLSPTRIIIAKTGVTSKLKCLINNQEVTTDVTAALIGLWNKGNRAVKGDVFGILKPIVINTSGHNIVDATLVRSTRNEAPLELDKKELSQGRVTVLWKTLEHNDGSVIQLSYMGNPEVNISVDGTIEGQRPIEQILPHNSRIQERISNGLPLTALLLVAIYLGRSLRYLKHIALETTDPNVRTAIHNHFEFGRDIIFVLMVVNLILAIWWFFPIFLSSPPPFAL